MDLTTPTSVLSVDVATTTSSWGTINNVTDMLYVPSSQMYVATWVTTSGSGFYYRTPSSNGLNAQISSNTRCFTSFIHPTTRTIIWGCSGSFFYTTTANKPLGSGTALPTKVAAGGGDYISGVLSASQNRLYLGSTIGLGILINLNTYSVEQLFFLVGNGALTQLTSAWLDEPADVIFWGTSDGRVARVNGASFKTVMAVALTNGTDPIGAVHSGPDPSNSALNATYFHAGLTSANYDYFTYALQKSNCPGYACSSCMGSGIVDSNYCGFCPSLGTCATTTQCAAAGTGWTQTGVCPAAMPDLSTGTTGSTAGSTTSVFTGTYFDTTNSDYSCVYNDGAGTSRTVSIISGSLTSTSVSCASPAWTGIVGSVGVSITRAGRTWASGWTFTYYSCGATTACASCGSNSQSECRWCFYTGSCSARSTCNLDTTSWDNWIPARCPVTNPITVGVALSPRSVARSVVVPVQFYATLPSSLTLTCYFKPATAGVPLPAAAVAATGSTVGSTVAGTSYISSVTCPFDPTTFTSNPAVGVPDSTSLAVSLGINSGSSAVFYGTSTPTAVSVVLYNCSALKVCATCSAMSECRWCGSTDGTTGSCNYKSVPTCPTGTFSNTTCSSISKILPAKAVLGSASALTLTITASDVPASTDRCWFSINGASGVSTGFSSSAAPEYKCPTPTINSASTVLVTLGSISGIVTNSINFVVYSCATRTSCGTCVSSDTTDQCVWCMDIGTPSCIEASATTATCSSNRVTSHDNTQCPTLSSSSPALFPMTGASNVTLIGNHRLVQTDAASALCRFDLPGSISNTTALTYVSASELLCATVPTSDSPGNASITVVNSADTAYTNAINVSYVTCSQFSDCGSCLGATLNEESFCEWCGSSCVSTCSSTDLLHPTCPFITSITPNYSILTGGDKISIYGSGFLVGTKKRSLDAYEQVNAQQQSSSTFQSLLSKASKVLSTGVMDMIAESEGESSSSRRDSLASGYSCYWDSVTETAVTVESSTLMTCLTPTRSTPTNLPLTLYFDGKPYLTTPGIDFFSCAASSSDFCTTDCTALEHCGWCVAGSTCTSSYQCSQQTSPDWQTETCASVKLDYTTIPVTGDVVIQANLSRSLPEGVAASNVLCAFGGVHVAANLVYSNETTPVPVATPVTVPSLLPIPPVAIVTPVSNETDPSAPVADPSSVPVEAPVAAPVAAPVGAVPVDAPLDTSSPDDEPVAAPVTAPRAVGVTCVAPAVLSPTTTTFSVLYNNDNFVAPVNFAYDDCSVHKGCTECISNANCGWCSRGNRCSFQMQCNTGSDWSKIKCPLNKVAVGVGVGIGLFALILLVLLAVFLIRRARKRDGLVIAVKEPDYNAIAWGADTTLWWRVPEHRYKILETALSRRDFLLQTAIAFNCPATEQDALAKALVYVAHTHGLAADMIQLLIRYEVQTCKAENTLFRSNSVASKMYKFFSRIVGIKYLFNCLARVIMELEVLGRKAQMDIEGGSKGSGSGDANEVSLLSMNMELDQTKVLGDDIDTDTNLLQLKLICQKLLNVIIKKSAVNIPNDFRKIFIEIDNSVMGRFAGSHDAVYKGIGGLFFLRFICPALTAPHVYGLLETPPNQVTQRQLVLITKVIQTIANMQEPGKKEEYMAALSDFIVASIPKIVTFYDNLRMAVNIPEHGEADNQDIEVPEEVTLNGLSVVWNFMFTMKDKMRAWNASEECPFNEEERAALTEIIDECEREYPSAPKKLKAGATSELEKNKSGKKKKK